jgi:hypothetical protein
MEVVTVRAVSQTMKNLVMLVALAVIGLCIWKYHSDSVKKAANLATVKAVEESRLELRKTKADLKQKYTSELEKIRAKSMKPAPMQAVAISRMLEDWYTALFSNLNQTAPQDLVPPLTVARERLLDSKALVEPAKQPIYDTAVNLLNRMIAVAEERTRGLESLTSAEANPRGSLDSKQSVVGSRTFFANSAMRKWEETRKQTKPSVDQLYTALRNQERVWNQKAGPDAAVDSYDLGSLAPVLITAETPASSSSLNQGTYGQSRPWRRTYYTRYSGAYNYRY